MPCPRFLAQTSASGRLSCTPDSASAAAACRRTSGRSWPVLLTWGWRGTQLPARGGRDQPAPAEILRVCRYACSAPRSSPVSMTCGIPRPWMWRRSCTGWEHRSPCTTRRRLPAHAGHARDSVTLATVTEAAQDAHVVLLLTEWPEFAGLSPGDLGSVVARRNIVDGRNALDPALWRTAGWNYRALGVAATWVPSQRSAVRQSTTGGRHGRSR